MCISILSTAHPDYPFILLSNRDEFLNRPTLRADWWDAPHDQVFGGRDLKRQERGTWLGITKQGRFAVLTNFRDEGVEINKDKSRGGIVNAWLTASPEDIESEEAFVERMLNDVGIYDCGGFTLLFGRLRSPSQSTKNEKRASETNQQPGEAALPGLAIISNRTESSSSIKRIATTVGETHGLSNSWYGDMTWPKVVHGEQLLKQAIAANVSRGGSQDHFIESLFDILSVDTLPRRKHGEVWEVYTANLRKSIFIPPAKGEVVDNSKGEDLAVLGGDDSVDVNALIQVGEGGYGTRNQTVILVDRHGKVKFIERTLYTETGIPMVKEHKDRGVEFQIDGWLPDDRSTYFLNGRT